MRNRLALSLAVALSCVLMACSSTPPTATTRAPAAAATSAPAATLTFQLDWIPNVQHFGPVYADQQGLYKATGLNVKVQAGGQGIDGLQMVAAGAADVAVSSAMSIYVANEHGLDLVGFAAVYQKSASALVCRGDRASAISKTSPVRQSAPKAQPTLTPCRSYWARTASNTPASR